MRSTSSVFVADKRLMPFWDFLLLAKNSKQPGLLKRMSLWTYSD